MNPLVLLGAAVAFLAFTKRPTQPTESVVTTGQPENPEPLAPTFNTAPLPEKGKPTSELAQQQMEAAPIAGISPSAPGTMPPYVYAQIPDFASLGAFEPSLME